MIPWHKEPTGRFETLQFLDLVDEAEEVGSNAAHITGCFQYILNALKSVNDAKDEGVGYELEPRHIVRLLKKFQAECDSQTVLGLLIKYHFLYETTNAEGVTVVRSEDVDHSAEIIAKLKANGSKGGKAKAANQSDANQSDAEQSDAEQSDAEQEPTEQEPTERKREELMRKMGGGGGGFYEHLDNFNNRKSRVPKA